MAAKVGWSFIYGIPIQKPYTTEVNIQICKKLFLTPAVRANVTMQ